MIIKDILEKGIKMLKDKKNPSAVLDAEVLLMNAIDNKQPERVLIYLNIDKKISKRIEKKYFQLIHRRQRKEPIAYIIKRKEFYGLNFYVDKNVLIPRPETELIIEIALKEISDSFKKISRTYLVADIGTGSGCIGITIANKLKMKKSYYATCLADNMRQESRQLKYKIYVSDISREALKVAKLNAQKHKVSKQIIFLRGALLNPLPKKVDLIIANLPYISDKEFEFLPNDIKKFEPKIALKGGDSGLNYYRPLLQKADNYLLPYGKILLEIGWQQKEKATEIIKKFLPKSRIKFIKDYNNIDRCVLIKT